MAISGPVAHGLSIGPVCALPRHHKVGRARTLSPPGARGRAGVLSSRRNRMRISVTSQAALLDHGGSVTAPPLQMPGAKKPQRGERPALWRAALALSVLIDLDGSGSIPRRATGMLGSRPHVQPWSPQGGPQPSGPSKNPKARRIRPGLRTYQALCREAIRSPCRPCHRPDSAWVGPSSSAAPRPSPPW
jgi:hypothetical protein